MAKTQTFVSKSSKKGTTDQISVKVVMMEKSEKGTYKFSERFVKVKELAEVEKLAKV